MGATKMTVSAAQKRAKNKYDATHYSVIGCKIKTEIADQFRDYAIRNGTTVNALFTGFISDCLASDRACNQGSTQPNNADSMTDSAGNISPASVE